MVSLDSGAGRGLEDIFPGRPPTREDDRFVGEFADHTRDLQTRPALLPELHPGYLRILIPGFLSLISSNPSTVHSANLRVIPIKPHYEPQFPE